MLVRAVFKFSALFLAATIILLCATQSARATYDSPYHVEVQYATTQAPFFTGIAGNCSNPNFSQATNDGIGSFIGMEGETYYNETSIGASIGRYSPPVNAYTGYFVDNVQYAENGSGNYTETFFPFTNRPVQSSSAYQITYANSTTANSFINGQTAASNLNEEQSYFQFDVVGLQQAIASGGAPQVFANFTSGSNCSSLQTQASGGSYGFWPASVGNNLNVVTKDPPDEAAAGAYANQTFTITH